MQLGTRRGWRRVPWCVPGLVAAAEHESTQCASRDEQREARQAPLNARRAEDGTDAAIPGADT